ncbi:hypothetical protein MMC26_002196 [Xylographa opegraphella]|nr:hypothetical protein [Xylographa opegraphella]
MSFGFGIGDIIAVAGKAFMLYQLCSQSSEHFMAISSQAGLLHIVLKQNKENVEKTKLTPEKSADLAMLIKACDEVLNDLAKLLEKYEAFSTKEQSVWNHFKLGRENVTKLQKTLDTNIACLTAYNVGLTNAANWRSVRQSFFLVRVEKALKKITQEHRVADDRSIFSSETTESTVKLREVWNRTTDQLQDAGVSKESLTERADHIARWIIQTSKDGIFETDFSPISQADQNSLKENTDPLSDDNVETALSFDPRRYLSASAVHERPDEVWAKKIFGSSWIPA